MKTGTEEWKALIQDRAKEFDISVNREHLNLFALHADTLLTWNKKTNLTAITDPEEIAVKHFLDSLLPSAFIPSHSKILDIGSGGGFPGIPLKILQPSLNLTMIDSVRKKISFLQYLIRSIKLKDINALHIRADDLAKKQEAAGAFDIVICRALTSLDKFVIMALPFLKKTGFMLALKGKILQEEIEAVHLLKIDGLTMEMEKYTLPVFHAERTIFKIRVS